MGRLTEMLLTIDIKEPCEMDPFRFPQRGSIGLTDLSERVSRDYGLNELVFDQRHSSRPSRIEEDSIDDLIM